MWGVCVDVGRLFWTPPWRLGASETSPSTHSQVALGTGSLAWKLRGSWRPSALACQRSRNAQGLHERILSARSGSVCMHQARVSDWTQAH
jgi:hypothetical protein